MYNKNFLNLTKSNFDTNLYSGRNFSFNPKTFSHDEILPFSFFCSMKVDTVVTKCDFKNPNRSKDSLTLKELSLMNYYKDKKFNSLTHLIDNSYSIFESFFDFKEDDNNIIIISKPYKVVDNNKVVNKITLSCPSLNYSLDLYYIFCI